MSRPALAASATNEGTIPTEGRGAAGRVAQIHVQTRCGLGVTATFVAAAVVTGAVGIGDGWWLPLHLFVVGALLTAISAVTQMLAVTWSTAPAPRSAVAAHTLGVTAAAAQRAAAAARPIGRAAAAAAGVTATANAVVTAVTAGTLGCKLSDRSACRHREGLCGSHRCREDRRRGRARHDQRGEEIQFRHHDSVLLPAAANLNRLIFQQKL